MSSQAMSISFFLSARDSIAPAAPECDFSWYTFAYIKINNILITQSTLRNFVIQAAAEKKT